MKPKFLLTSFTTWLPHQKSNSSDDILVKIQELNYSLDVSLSFLRKLPVNVELASQRVIAAIDRIQPDVIVCCGMSEKRDKATVESKAFCQDACLYTSVNLTELSERLVFTEVSGNAGKFVCEGLYYQVLKYIQFQNRARHCIFVHIPLLNCTNLDLILKDFHSMFFYLGNIVVSDGRH